MPEELMRSYRVVLTSLEDDAVVVNKIVEAHAPEEAIYFALESHYDPPGPSFQTVVEAKSYYAECGMAVTVFVINNESDSGDEWTTEWPTEVGDYFCYGGEMREGKVKKLGWGICSVFTTRERDFLYFVCGEYINKISWHGVFKSVNDVVPPEIPPIKTEKE